MEATLENVSTNELIHELKLRGYIVYHKYFWQRLKRCPCGRKPGIDHLYKGIHTMECGGCGRKASGRTEEEEIRAWNKMAEESGK